MAGLIAPVFTKASFILSQRPDSYTSLVKPFITAVTSYHNYHQKLQVIRSHNILPLLVHGGNHSHEE